MTSQDTDRLDDRVRAALHGLGAEAAPMRRPPDASGESPPRRQHGARRSLVPVLGVAAAVAVITTGVTVATWSTGSDSDPEAGAGASHGDATTEPATSPETASPGTGGSAEPAAITLGAVAGWRTESPDGCKGIRGETDQVVFELDSFELDCLAAIDRAGTSVFAIPLPDKLVGESLQDVTTPWEGPSPVGHDLRRLSGGTLAELNSVYADGVACLDCDRMYVVLGPDPATVRSIVESVRSAG